jgi:hypothetical protein
MTNHYVNYEDFVINRFQDNQPKPCGLPMDRRTLAKQYTPSSSKGGIKMEFQVDISNSLSYGADKT